MDASLATFYRRLAALVISLALLAPLIYFTFSPSPVHADGLVIGDCPPPPCAYCDPTPIQPPVPPRFGTPDIVTPLQRPQPPQNCETYLTVKNHNVTVTIDNQVARTLVDETFVNPTELSLEGTYLFPLPDDAAISEFAMFVDGTKIQGQVLDRDQAKRIYQDIVNRRRDPALLEYVGRNAFQAHIFPIAPHAERRVQISYSQVLANQNGLVKYVYPLDTEKFSPDPVASISVSVELKSHDALKAIYSPSHPVLVARHDDYSATIGYEAANVKPDRDFVLYYSLSSNAIDGSLLSYKSDSNSDGYFLLLLTPQVNSPSQEIIAKDVILVLDTSGSMQGQKIDQAKRALKYVLDQLGPDDRFNVISFSTSLVPYASGLQPASAVADAKDFVDRLAASGSTDINRALLEALSEADPKFSDSGRPAVVIFMTDGLPTTGETDINNILVNVDRAASPNVRLFTFGVGDDVNTVLLDSLSEKHRGTSAYVRPTEKIDDTVSEFYSKIAKPVLSDLAIDWAGAAAYDVYPYPLPDLFSGSQLVISGRYKNPAPTVITLTGQVNGVPRQFRFEDLTLASSGGDSFIAPLWATRKIGYLLAQIRLHGENREAVDEIVALAVRYGIVTPYTSFLIDDRNDVLTESGRGGAAENLHLQLSPSASPPSGATAIAKSQANRALKDTDTAALNSDDQVKLIGDKAFILRQGAWIDTTFDPSKMIPIKIPFGSDQYFKMLEQHPDLAQFLALGQQVIFMQDGAAYQVY